MRARKNFWDRNAGLYDCFMRKDRIVYEKMYELICPVAVSYTHLDVYKRQPHELFRTGNVGFADIVPLCNLLTNACFCGSGRNCVKLTQFLLSPCGSIGEITLGIFQRLFQKFLQLIRIIIHPMVGLRKFNIVVWNVVQNVRSH